MNARQKIESWYPGLRQELIVLLTDGQWQSNPELSKQLPHRHPLSVLTCLDLMLEEEPPVVEVDRPSKVAFRRWRAMPTGEGR